MNTKLLLPFFLIFGYCSFGQGIRDTIEVSRKFKTILIFQENIAESIIGSDIGFSIDLPKEVGSKFNSRILKIYYDDLAVEKENFTNLTVITESGNLYDFILKLSYSPNNLTWNISSDMAEVNINKEKKKKNAGSSLEIHTKDIDQNVEVPNDSIPQFTSQTVYADNPEEYYRTKSFYMQFDKAKIPRYFARKDNVFLWLKGVYYNNNELYVQLKLENKEGIDLDINFIKYFIESSYKNTTKQKIPITKKSGLLYEYKVPITVKGNTENHFVLVFKQFTLDNKKSLLIELDEESGNRNLSLRIGKDILNKPIRF